jgi:hypothetical protein
MFIFQNNPFFNDIWQDNQQRQRRGTQNKKSREIFLERG